MQRNSLVNGRIGPEEVEAYVTIFECEAHFLSLDSLKSVIYLNFS